MHRFFMSCFSTALTKVLYDLRWTQNQLAQVSGVKRPQINRYVNGTGGIKLDGVKAILQAVPEDKRPGLLVAWLKDQTPPEFHFLVDIFPVQNLVREEPPPWQLPPETDPALQRLIEWVTSRCIHNKDFRTFLENTRRLIDGTGESPRG